MASKPIYNIGVFQNLGVKEWLRLAPQCQPAKNKCLFKDGVLQDLVPEIVSKRLGRIGLGKGIYYIKVHKTGSSTMQNVLHRFAMKHDLKVALYNSDWANVFLDTTRTHNMKVT